MRKWKITIVLLGLIQSLAANASLTNVNDSSVEFEKAPTLKSSFLTSSCHQAIDLDNKSELSDSEETQLDNLLEAIADVSESNPVEYCLMAGEYAVRQEDTEEL